MQWSSANKVRTLLQDRAEWLAKREAVDLGQFDVTIRGSYHGDHMNDVEKQEVAEALYLCITRMISDIDKDLELHGIEIEPEDDDG